MGVYKRGESYAYRFMYKGSEYNGKCKGCFSEREAEKYERAIRKAVEEMDSCSDIRELYERFRERMMRSSGIPIRSAFDAAMGKPTARKACEARMRFKRTYWGRFADFAENECGLYYMQEVEPRHAENFVSMIRKSGIEPSTANCIQGTISQVFSLLRNETGIQNPFDGIEKLKSSHDSHLPYSPEELSVILEKADGFIKPLFVVGMFTGLRLGDICCLKVSSIDFAHGFIFVSQRKTGAQVSIPMCGMLSEYLRATCPPCGEYAFPELALKYSESPAYIERRVTAFLESNGIQTGFISENGRKKNTKGIHSLRHTLISLAGSIGVPETVVRSIVGHMTPEMTRLYTKRINDEFKAKAASMIENSFGEFGYIGSRSSLTEAVSHEEENTNELALYENGRLEETEISSYGGGSACGNPRMQGTY